jgi:hypothetical protein
VVEPSAVNYIDDDEASWERAPLERPARTSLLAHVGEWPSLVMAWICGALLQAGLLLALHGGFGVVGLARIQSGCAALVCIWLLVNSLKFAARTVALDSANLVMTCI